MKYYDNLKVARQQARKTKGKVCYSPKHKKYYVKMRKELSAWFDFNNL